MLRAFGVLRHVPKGRMADTPERARQLLADILRARASRGQLISVQRSRLRIGRRSTDIVPPSITRRSRPVAVFPVPAHQTGRADFPHPTSGRDHTCAHGRPRGRRRKVDEATAGRWRSARTSRPSSPCASDRDTVGTASPRYRYRDPGGRRVAPKHRFAAPRELEFEPERREQCVGPVVGGGLVDPDRGFYPGGRDRHSARWRFRPTSVRISPASVYR